MTDFLSNQIIKHWTLFAIWNTILFLSSLKSTCVLKSPLFLRMGLFFTTLCPISYSNSLTTATVKLWSRWSWLWNFPPSICFASPPIAIKSNLCYAPFLQGPPPVRQSDTKFHINVTFPRRHLYFINENYFLTVTLGKLPNLPLF